MRPVCLGESPEPGQLLSPANKSSCLHVLKPGCERRPQVQTAAPGRPRSIRAR